MQFIYVDPWAAYLRVFAAVRSPVSLSLIPICGGAIALLALLIVTHHPVREPQCALKFRLATLHRVSGPGYVFVLPFLEHIEDKLYLGPRKMQVAVPLAMPAEVPANAVHLDITWRIHASVRGRPSPSVRDMLLEPDELRAKLVNEAIAHAAGWVLMEYQQDDLTVAVTRQSMAHTIACTANAELASRSLLVERVFWRA